MLLELQWAFVADTVMGGVSRGAVTHGSDGLHSYARLTGEVSLENNGGFIQMAADLQANSAPFDAGDYSGVVIMLRGNGEYYDIRLRTDAMTRPWQSFRAEVVACPEWTAERIPFARFQPHRTTVRFDPLHLRRVGVLAIGREMTADVSVAEFGFYA